MEQQVPEKLLPGLTTTETNFRLNTSFKVKAGFITNAGLRDFSGIIALALVDKQGKVKQLISDSKNIDLSTMNAAGQISGNGVVFSCKITETLVGWRSDQDGVTEPEIIRMILSGKA